MLSSKITAAIKAERWNRLAIASNSSSTSAPNIVARSIALALLIGVALAALVILTVQAIEPAVPPVDRGWQ